MFLLYLLNNKTNMKIFQIIVITTFIVFFSLNIMAQKTKPTKDKDVEVIDFGSNEKSAKSKKALNHPIILKTSPTMPIFGKALFEMEYGINDFFSIEAGIGPTFGSVLSGKSSILEEFSDSNLFCDSKNWNEDICDDFLDQTIRKQGVGIRFEIEPKLYLSSEALEGTSISAVFRYTRSNFDVQPIIDDGNGYTRSPEFTFNEKVNYLDYLVRLNNQTLYPKLSFEYFIGGGIRSENSTRQDIGFDSFGVAGNGSVNIKSSQFIFDAGIRIGFQL